MEAAVRLLAARALSARELGDRLARRGHAPREIVVVLDDLRSRGYLDDLTLAYNAASAMATRRSYGRARAAAELRRRGIAADTAAAAVQRAFADVDEDGLALVAVRRLGPVPRGPDGRRKMQRIARSLLRKGLSRSAVGRALRSLGGEAEDLDLEPDGNELEADP